MTRALRASEISLVVSQNAMTTPSAGFLQTGKAGQVSVNTELG